MRYKRATKRRAYDFAGWVTKHNIKCSDGRTIREGAFIDQDGETVPLVWMHQAADDITKVIGNCKLQYTPEGVIGYASFNNTDLGRTGKELVDHGDVTHLSIRANKLTQTPRGDVLHGTIREVSLVLAGANPGAVIEKPVLSHGDEATDEIILYWNNDEIVHGEGLDDPDALMRTDVSGDEDDDDDYAGFDQDYYDHDEDDEYEEEQDMPTYGDIWESMTDEQQDAVLAVIEDAIADAEGYYDEDDGYDEYDDYDDSYYEDSEYDDDPYYD